MPEAFTVLTFQRKTLSGPGPLSRMRFVFPKEGITRGEARADALLQAEGTKTFFDEALSRCGASSISSLSHLR